MDKLPAAAALMTIDLQNEYRADGAYPVEHYEEILGKTAELMQSARNAGMQVWHVYAAVEDIEQTEYALLHDNICDDRRSAVAGSFGAEICREVAPEPGDVVFRKIWPSAFHRSDLASRLKASGIDTLFISGVWTDSCVRASVFDAIFAGFHVWLIKDLCGSGTDLMSRVAVLDISNRLYGGGVTSSDRVHLMLKGEIVSNWHCTRPVEFLYSKDTIDSLYDAL